MNDRTLSDAPKKRSWGVTAMGPNATDTAVYCSLLALWAVAMLKSALRPDEKTDYGNRLVTQRRRYARALFAEGLFAASAAWLLLTESPGGLWLFIKGLYGSMGPASLVLDACLALIPLNLVILPASFLYLYWRPVPAAYWSKKGYCPTVWRREGYRSFVTELELMDLKALGFKPFKDITPQNFGAPPT